MNKGDGKGKEGDEEWDWDKSSRYSGALGIINSNYSPIVCVCVCVCLCLVKLIGSGEVPRNPPDRHYQPCRDRPRHRATLEVPEECQRLFCLVAISKQGNIQQQQQSLPWSVMFFILLNCPGNSTMKVKVMLIQMHHDDDNNDDDDGDDTFGIFPPLTREENEIWKITILKKKNKRTQR